MTLRCQRWVEWGISTSDDTISNQHDSAEGIKSVCAASGFGGETKCSSHGRTGVGIVSLDTTPSTRIEGPIPVDLPIRNNRKFLFISRNQRAFTHGIHKYPAKFFPELPRWIIERYSEPGDYVLDPFMGSGTSNLEALLLDRDSAGVDVDPFSRFIAKVKTTPIHLAELHPGHITLRERMERDHEHWAVAGMPDFPYRDRWFKPYILRELAYIKSSIESLDVSQTMRNFFLLCFSSIIRAVSEADNNCTRTVIRKKLNKQVLPLAAINLFLKRMDTNVKNMALLAEANPSATVYIPDNTDARDLGLFGDNSFDLALTSPPYLNAVDYPRTHQLEMYWLGFESGSLHALKSKHVGTEVVYAKDYATFHQSGCRLADRAIAEIFKHDPRRAYIATKYILDMTQNLMAVHRVLKPGKHYVIVIGNNLVRGVAFESWRYLKAIAQRLGYHVECHFISEIINHFIKVPRKERINDDHVLVLKKLKCSDQWARA